MEIFRVKCPGCGMEFYADLLLQTLPVSLHCPRCALYFGQRERVDPGGAGTRASPLVGRDGRITEDMIYCPKASPDGENTVPVEKNSLRRRKKWPKH